MATKTRPYAIRRKANGELIAGAQGVTPRDALGLYASSQFSVEVASADEMYQLGKRQIPILDRDPTAPEPATQGDPAQPSSNQAAGDEPDSSGVILWPLSSAAS